MLRKPSIDRKFSGPWVTDKTMSGRCDCYQAIHEPEPKAKASGGFRKFLWSFFQQTSGGLWVADRYWSSCLTPSTQVEVRVSRPVLLHCTIRNLLVPCCAGRYWYVCKSEKPAHACAYALLEAAAEEVSFYSQRSGQTSMIIDVSGETAVWRYRCLADSKDPSDYVLLHSNS